MVAVNVTRRVSGLYSVVNLRISVTPCVPRIHRVPPCCKRLILCLLSIVSRYGVPSVTSRNHSPVHSSKRVFTACDRLRGVLQKVLSPTARNVSSSLRVLHLGPPVCRRQFLRRRVYAFCRLDIAGGNIVITLTGPSISLYRHLHPCPAIGCRLSSRCPLSTISGGDLHCRPWRWRSVSGIVTLTAWLLGRVFDKCGAVIVAQLCGGGCR